MRWWEWCRDQLVRCGWQASPLVLCPCRSVTTCQTTQAAGHTCSCGTRSSTGCRWQLAVQSCAHAMPSHSHPHEIPSHALNLIPSHPTSSHSILPRPIPSYPVLSHPAVGFSESCSFRCLSAAASAAQSQSMRWHSFDLPPPWSSRPLQPASPSLIWHHAAPSDLHPTPPQSASSPPSCSSWEALPIPQPSSPLPVSVGAHTQPPSRCRFSPPSAHSPSLVSPSSLTAHAGRWSLSRLSSHPR
mgnify:CR=1 FL=1